MFFFSLSWGVETKEVLDIPPGSSVLETGSLLKRKGFIRSEFVWKALSKVYGGPSLSYGEYELGSSLSLWTQFQRLRRGRMHFHYISFPEGWNHHDMKEALLEAGWPHAQDFLTLVWSEDFIFDLLGERRTSLEGYLFPETYLIGKYVSAEDLIRQMVRNFFQVYPRDRPSKSQLSFS